MRSKKILTLCMAVLMLTTILAVGCGKTAEKTVVIGVTAPLSGTGAGYGEDIKSGLDMAIKKINGDGGITVEDTKYIFRLQSADDQICLLYTSDAADDLLCVDLGGRRIIKKKKKKK